ncbi:unnamed protein product [Ilex paraguariensis]|uniref:Protein PATRONUS 2 n=1 Tax=Ilex paraguariensis TaxID=185542 RepID=A0ABC8UUJ4_9AQUA
MTSHVTKRPLIIRDENLGIPHKKAVLDGVTKNSKPAAKKGGEGLGGRKALNDITNKSSVLHEASTRKKNLLKEEFNIADEKFLHDHTKCIEVKEAAMKPRFFDTVLPGHDSMSSVEFADSNSVKANPDSPLCYPEPVELPMTEFSDWLKSSTRQSSPINWDSPPSSPFAWGFEAVEFLLKPENDCRL